jgi:hypothetical protein
MFVIILNRLSDVKYFRPAVVVPLGEGRPFYHWSFPRRRESSPPLAHRQSLARWIPAFAEMTIFDPFQRLWGKKG